NRQSEQLRRRVGRWPALLAIALHLSRHAPESIQTQHLALLVGPIPAFPRRRRQTIVEPNLFRNNGRRFIEELLFIRLFNLPRQRLQPMPPLRQPLVGLL